MGLPNGAEYVITRTMPSNTFLTHVAGLRGVAIILVILFHFTQGNAMHGSFEFKNGFLGVDIFMVLMGYFLIYGMIHKPDLSFYKFLKGKINRLICPLAVVIILCSIIGIFVLDYSHLAQMAKTGAYALIGASNFSLIRDSKDYFSLDSSMNCMLHTWYIAAALQLFILAYIFYWVSRRWKKSWKMITLCIVGLISLFIHLKIQKYHLAALGIPTAVHSYILSYYSPIPRIWEILSGGIVLLIPDVQNRHWKNWLFVSGLVFIVAGFSIPLVNYHALATLLIVTGCILTVKFYTQGPIGMFLSNKYIVWIGNISFSLYLIHMPLFVLYKGGTMRIPSTVELVILFILTVFVGYIFYHLVEKRKYHPIVYSSCFLTAISICYILVRTDGLKYYWNVESNKIAASIYLKKRYAQYKELGESYNHEHLITHSHKGYSISKDSDKNQKKGKITPFWQLGPDYHPASFVVIGDSHAAMNYAGLDTICHKHNISGVLLDTLILPFWNRRYGQATESYSINGQKINSFLQWIEHQESLDSVIIIFSWYWVTDLLNQDAEGTAIGVSTQANMASMEQFLTKLKQLNRKAIVFAPLPRFKTGNTLMYARFRHKWNLTGAFNEHYIVRRNEYLTKWGECISTLQKYAKNNLCYVIDPAPYLFKEDDVCYPFDESGVIFRDCNHYSADTSIKIAEAIQNQLIPILQKTPPAH